MEGSGLTRQLGAMDGAAIIVSNVVGLGIFTTPGLVASMVGGPGTYMAVWLAGGILALIGGLVYAELGAAYPEAGGEYVYIREAFGPAAAFLSGWTSLVAGFSGAIAAGAVGCAIYLEQLVPGLPGGRKAVALGLIAGLALVHARGLRPGRRVLNVLAALSVAAMVALVAAGLTGAELRLVDGSLPTGATASPDAAPSPADVPAADASAGGWPEPVAGGPFLALVLVMFTYSGWNAATYVAGEIRSPRRDLRAAVIGGTLLVTWLYLALNGLYLRVIPPASLAGSATAAELAGARALGGVGGAIVAVVIVLALASGVSAMLLAGPRVYYAMARDGALPPAFGRVDPRTGVPSFAVTVQALWSAALVLVGTFGPLLAYTGFAVVLFSAAAVAALFVLRRRPGYPAYRTLPRWGYPALPLAFLAASGAMLVQAIRFAPGPSLAGLAIIAAGLPLHLATRRRAGIRPDRVASISPVKGDAS